MNQIEDKGIGLYTEDGIIFTGEIENGALRLLATTAEGMLLEELGNKINTAILALQNDPNTEKTSVDLKLEFSKSKNNQVIDVKGKVKINLPARDFTSGVFATANGIPTMDIKKAVPHSRG